MKATIETPRIELWRNAKKEYAYRLIAGNGKAIQVPGEGYKRIAGLISNIKAIYSVAALEVSFHRIPSGAIAGELHFPSGQVLNVYWVDGPKAKKEKR